MSDELLYSLIAYKYFESNGSFYEFVEYLKNRDKEEEIFRWLQDVSRWDTYNYLLSITCNFLKNDDDEFFKKMSYLINIKLNDIIDDINNYFVNGASNQNNEYPKISFQEFDKLFCEFLGYIGAPAKWFDIYDNLKIKGLIIMDEDTEEDNSMCFLDKDGTFKILISSGDNLRGFCSFIHEFIHYVSRMDGLSISKFSISEFPSIFFEVISAEFLKNSGYSSEIVNQIKADRESNNISIYTAMISLFIDLMRYINYGQVSRMDKVTLYQKQLDSINCARKKMLALLIEFGEEIKNPSEYEELEIDIEKTVDDECDSLVDAFIREGLLVINGYQYLLDSYLAEKVLEKRDNDGMIMQKMIDVTNNLRNMGVKDILRLFDIEETLQKDYIKKLVRVKSDLSE